jgi:hypothetical protein
MFSLLPINQQLLLGHQNVENVDEEMLSLM